MRCALIVDDDAAHGRMLVDFLREEGWDACATTEAAGALALLRAGGPTLVVSDVVMDGQGGFELLRAIRADANPVPVILMSSFGTGATAEQAHAAGAFAFLSKPFPPRQLLALVERAHEGTPG